jgi:hypothetical protein
LDHAAKLIIIDAVANGNQLIISGWHSADDRAIEVGLWPDPEEFGGSKTGLKLEVELKYAT